MEQYLDLPPKGSLIQKVERWKQKVEDREMNFNTLTRSMTAANCEFFPNIQHMLKHSHKHTNQLMLLWTILLCFETSHDIGWGARTRKTYSVAWLYCVSLCCNRVQENCVIMFLYYTCFALCSVQHFVSFCNCQLQAWHSFGLYLNMLNPDYIRTERQACTNYI